MREPVSEGASVTVQAQCAAAAAASPCLCSSHGDVHCLDVEVVAEAAVAALPAEAALLQSSERRDGSVSAQLPKPTKLSATGIATTATIATRRNMMPLRVRPRLIMVSLM